MDTLVTDDVLFILAKSEQYFCQILHLITSCMEICQKKQIYNRYKPKLTASQKKKDLGEKELYLTAKKP